MSSFDDKFKDLTKKENKPEINDKTLEKLAKFGKEKKEITGKFMQTLNAFFKILPLIIISFLSLFLIGLDTFLEGQWQWSNLLEPSFWYSYINLQAAKWLMGISFLLAAIRKLKETHTIYKKYLDNIQLKVNQDNENEFISPQVEIEKIIRKQYFLELKVGRKLLKYKTRYEIIDLDDFLTATNDDVKKNIENYSTSKKRWVKWRLARVHELLIQEKDKLSLNWQKKYLKGYKIKYPKISRQAITSGFAPKSDETSSFSEYKPQMFKTTMSYIGPSTLAATAFSMFVMIFDIIRKEPTIGSWFILVMKILLIFWNTFTILTMATDIFNNTYLRSAEERSHDLGRFHKRHLNNNHNEQEILEILEYDENDAIKIDKKLAEAINNIPIVEKETSPFEVGIMELRKFEVPKDEPDVDSNVVVKEIIEIDTKTEIDDEKPLKKENDAI